MLNGIRIYIFDRCSVRSRQKGYEELLVAPRWHVMVDLVRSSLVIKLPDAN